MIRRVAAISILVVIVALAPVRAVVAAQGPDEQQDLTIDAAMRTEIIEGIIKRLNSGYVFPEVAKKMEQDLRDRVQKKEYDSISSAKGFARKLTSDLQEVSHDKHLRVLYSHEAIPVETPNHEPSAEERERFLNFLRTINFGFEKVERLPGNVGYLDLRGFLPATLGAETATAAMNLLANSDALIIDVRKNGGGDPAMVALITSYLFGPSRCT